MTEKKDNFTVVSAEVGKRRVTTEAEIMAVLSPIVDPVKGTEPDFSLVSEAIVQSVADADAEIAQKLDDLSDKISVDTGHYLNPPGEDEDAW
ncbi:MAG: hypothetical protein QNJ44_19755 [Rhodobacter sp.]|nr:hypothetical protein [Rhodobacter sp.]